MGAKTTGGKLQNPRHDTKTWVVTGTKGMFSYPAGEETIRTGTNSLSNAAEMVLDRLLRLVWGR